MWELKLKSNSSTSTSKGSYRDSSGNKNIGQNTNYKTKFGNSKSLDGLQSIEKIEYCLRNIKGIGSNKAKELINYSGISKKSLLQLKYNNTQINGIKGDLKSLQTVNKRNIEKLYNKLTEMRRDGLIDDSFIEIWHQNINKELKVNSYRGTRHRKKYPIKGRTRSNANTRKRWKI
jgi:ribosomal protein S13